MSSEWSANYSSLKAGDKIEIEGDEAHATVLHVVTTAGTDGMFGGGTPPITHIVTSRGAIEFDPWCCPGTYRRFRIIGHVIGLPEIDIRMPSHV